MIPLILGLGGLAAKVAAAAVIPRIFRAISRCIPTTTPTRPPEPVSVERISSGSETPQTTAKWGVSLPQPRSRKWGYAGLFHHEPSGLDLATRRTYDSAQGRWLSRDPLGEGADRTLYSYCGNKPINCTDPTGLGYSEIEESGRIPNPYDGSVDYVRYYLKAICFCEGDDKFVDSVINLKRPDNLYPSDFQRPNGPRRKPRPTGQVGYADLYSREEQVNVVPGPLVLPANGTLRLPVPTAQLPVYGKCTCRRCDGTTYDVNPVIQYYIIIPEFPQ